MTLTELYTLIYQWIWLQAFGLTEGTVTEYINELIDGLTIIMY